MLGGTETFGPVDRHSREMRCTALGLCATLLLAACGTRLDNVESGAGTSGRGDLRPIVPAIAYVMVGADPIVRGDRPAYLRLPGATPTQIGTGQMLTAAGDDVLLLQRFDGHIQAFRGGPKPVALHDRMAQGSRPNGLVVGDVVYELEYPGVVATNASGVTRNVPIPSARPTDSVTFCEIRKMMVDPRGSGARALATASGHVYAFVSTYVNGAIVDLTDGRRLDLPESGPAIAMTGGTDGKLYALTIDERCSTNPPVVRRIDPVTMREEAVIDTQRRLGFDNIELVGGRGGATYVHAVRATSAELLRVDAASVAEIPLPADSGLLAAVAPGGSVYLFGGRARNIVSRFDPVTGAIATVDEARGPDGSFVQALLFPSEARRP
jgi:hypothetical protein